MTPFETLKTQIHFLSGATHSIMPENVRATAAPVLIDLLQQFARKLEKTPLKNKELRDLYNTVLKSDHPDVLQTAIDTLPGAITDDPNDKPLSGPEMSWTTPEPLAALLWIKFMPKTRFMGHIKINASSSVTEFSPAVLQSFLRAESLWANPSHTDWNSLYKLRLDTTAKLPRKVIREFDHFLRARITAEIMERQFNAIRNSHNNLQEVLTFLAVSLTVLPREDALALIARTDFPTVNITHHKRAAIIRDAPDSDAYLGMPATEMGQQFRLHFARKGHEWAMSNKIRRLLKIERPINKNKAGPWMANTEEAKAKRAQRRAKAAQKAAEVAQSLT